MKSTIVVITTSDEKQFNSNTAKLLLPEDKSIGIQSIAEDLLLRGRVFRHHQVRGGRRGAAVSSS